MVLQNLARYFNVTSIIIIWRLLTHISVKVDLTVFCIV